MPKHWFIIKEFGIYTVASGIGESTSIQSTLKRCDEKYQDDLRTIIYVNIILDTSRKLLEQLSKLIASDLLIAYIRNARDLAKDFKKQLDTVPYNTLDELQQLIRIHSDVKKELMQLLDESLLRHKKNEVHSQPSKNVSKAISMIKSIDSGVLDHLTDKESTELKQNVAKLLEHVNQYADILELPHTNSGNTPSPIAPVEPILNKTFTVNLSKILKPVNVTPMVISSLCQTISFETASPCVAYFVDAKGEPLSNKYPVNFSEPVAFELNASASSLGICYLVIQHPSANDREVSQVIPFGIKMSFTSRFDF